MIFIKNYLFILILLISYILPLGGIGLSGIRNSISIDNSESEGALVLDFKSNSSSENGVNIFIYFDALPKDLAIEYNREIKFQPLTTTITYDALDPINVELSTFRISDYLTIRKEVVGLSIPILAKAALYVGGGLNQHKSVIPSITLLKDIYNVNEIDSLYDAAANQEQPHASAIFEKLAKNPPKSNGLHIQAGIQGKILIFNLFANARYTFIINDDGNSIENFPGITVGMAYGF